MTKITADHLVRSAVVYVRQSSVDQVVHNLESQRRQYGLEARARALGWSGVEVIDDDLGKSGCGVARRGFERLLALICEGASVRCFQSRPPASLETVETGTRCWNFAAWSARSLSTKMVSMILGRLTIDCSWG
ncbi:recombinase family protein [Bradyrhizobium sp. CCGUVB14]|uniref:recombinase family protein n=1 Tax=unclassified Bradyrhizobium TaxID=2631580 RepID=UPI0035C1EFB3